MIAAAKLHYGMQGLNDDEADAFWCMKYGEHFKTLPEPKRVVKKKERARKKKEPRLF
jgi:hypothetical protein